MRIDTSVAILASLSGAAAFWRMECRGQVGLARLDPLINPGGLSQHAHAIHGSSGEYSQRASQSILGRFFLTRFSLQASVNRRPTKTWSVPTAPRAP